MKKVDAMEFRRATLDERDAVEKIAKSTNNPDIKSFPGYWYKFGNWENNRPFILIDNDSIVGFTGATFQKNGTYMNFYAIGVKPELGGQGYGRLLWENTLLEAIKLGKQRVKLGAKKKYAGYAFFTKMGWKPIARKGDEYRFDVSIKGVKNFEEFKARLQEPQDRPPETELQKYKSMDECFFNDTQIRTLR